MKIHGNKKVYIVIPHVHGNGGWNGHHTLLATSFNKAKKTNPRREGWVDDDTYGIGMPWICCNENVNSGFLGWNGEKEIWEK